MEQMKTLLRCYRSKYAAYDLKLGLILIPISLATTLAALWSHQSYSHTPLPLLLGFIAVACAGSGSTLIFFHLQRYANYPALQELHWNRRRIAHSVLFSLYYLLTYRQHPAPPIRHLHPDAVMNGLAEPAAENRLTALCDRRTDLINVTTNLKAVTCRPCRAIGSELIAVHDNWLYHAAQYMS